MGNGSILAQRPASQGSPGAIATFASYLGSTPKARIFADGSANFAGEATTITSAGIVRVSRTSDTNDCFEAQLNGVAKATIKANGSANFEGTITADNVSFSIDNGATLDVKRVGNALVALKTAAAAASDFAALKSAIATALVDI